MANRSRAMALRESRGMSVQSTRKVIAAVWLVLMLLLTGRTYAAAPAASPWTDLAGTVVAAAPVSGAARLARRQDLASSDVPLSPRAQVGQPIGPSGSLPLLARGALRWPANLRVAPTVAARRVTLLPRGAALTVDAW